MKRLDDSKSINSAAPEVHCEPKPKDHQQDATSEAKQSPLSEHLHDAKPTNNKVGAVESASADKQQSEVNK